MKEIPGKKKRMAGVASWGNLNVGDLEDEEQSAMGYVGGGQTGEPA